jgi:hypothetical protein
MELTRDEKLWLLTAHPDTFDLYEEAPAWLIAACHMKGLLRQTTTPGVWRLSETGYAQWKMLLE